MEGEGGQEERNSMGNINTLILGCICILFGLYFFHIAIEAKKQGKEISFFPAGLVLGFGILMVLGFLFSSW